jgi:hypothetical protein
MLAWVTAKSAHVKLSAGLQSADDSASLLTRCTDHSDQFFIVGLSDIRAHIVSFDLLLLGLSPYRIDSFRLFGAPNIMLLELSCFLGIMGHRWNCGIFDIFRPWVRR